MKNTKNKKGEDGNSSQTACGCGDIVNDFIEDVWSVMTPQMVDRLKCILREDLGLSKQDADKFIECQREVRRKRICIKKNQRTVRIGPRNQWIKEVSKNIGDQMAAVVVGVLLSNRTARTKRITEKVLEHLCEITGEDTTVDSAKTRVERTLVVVADRMATWIDEAISDIEKTMQDKYMSAASLEALPIEVGECYPPLGTPSTSEASLSLSYTSTVESKVSVVATDASAGGEDVKDENERRETIKYAEMEETGEVEHPETESKGEESSGDNESTVQSTAEVYDDEEEESEKEDDEEPSSIEESPSIEEPSSIEELSSVEEPSSIEEEDSEPADEEESEEDKEEDMEEAEEEEDEDFEEEESDYDESGVEDTVKEEEEKVPSIVDVPSVSVVSSKKDINSLEGDILDLLKEDIKQLPREEEKSDRQIAMQKIIDERLEKVAKDKLDRSLDSLVVYDIDKAASIVANWVENILALADRTPIIPDYIGQGPAFEVKRGDGSQFEVSKVSSTSVAQKVAELRGLDPPLRKKKVPKTMSPMDLQSGKDWADWALGATNVGDEWGKWLDNTITDVENHLLSDRSTKSHQENYNEWSQWRDKRGQEAQKWRVEEQKIKDEGTLWNRKMKSDRKPTPPERETKSHTY